jgi:hypothetical protein
MMALALRFDDLLRTGKVKDYAELARLGQVSRARITQVMNLCLLAPDVQEQILFLPPIEHGRDRLWLSLVQRVALELNFQKQRRLWTNLLRERFLTSDADCRC